MNCSTSRWSPAKASACSLHPAAPTPRASRCQYKCTRKCAHANKVAIAERRVHGVARQQIQVSCPPSHITPTAHKRYLRRVRERHFRPPWQQHYICCAPRTLPSRNADTNNSQNLPHQEILDDSNCKNLRNTKYSTGDCTTAHVAASRRLAPASRTRERRC